MNTLLKKGVYISLGLWSKHKPERADSETVYTSPDEAESKKVLSGLHPEDEEEEEKYGPKTQPICISGMLPDSYFSFLTN